MTTFKPYMLDEPFETTDTGGRPVTVFAYSTGAPGFWVCWSAAFGWGSMFAGEFVTVPPIPVAAREPKPGEVWVSEGGHVGLLLREYSLSPGVWVTVDQTGWGYHWRPARPATEAEAEPFRPFLQSLQRSLSREE